MRRGSIVQGVSAMGRHVVLCVSVTSMATMACGSSESNDRGVSELSAIEAQSLDTLTAGWRPVQFPNTYTGLVDSLALTDSTGVFGDPIDLLEYREPLRAGADSSFTLEATLLTPVVEVGESPILVVSIQTNEDSVRFENDLGFSYWVLAQSGDTLFPLLFDSASVAWPETWLVLPPRSILAHVQNLSCIVRIYHSLRLSDDVERGSVTPGVVDTSRYSCPYGYELPPGTYRVVVDYRRDVERFDAVVREDGRHDYTRTVLGTVHRADTVQLRVVGGKTEAEKSLVHSDRLDGSLPELTASVFARTFVEERRGLSLTVSPVAGMLTVDASPYLIVGLLNMGRPTAIQNGSLNWHVGGVGRGGRENEEAIERSERLKHWLLLPHRSFFGQLVSARCPVLPNREGVTQQCPAVELEPGEYVIPVRYRRTIYDEAGRQSSVDLRDTARYVVRR